MAEKIFNNATRGMIRNVNPLKQDQNFYTFALNLSTDKNKIDRLTKVTENKLEDYYTLKYIDYVLLGYLYLNIDEYVFFITDKESSFSEIVYYNKGSISVLYDNDLLNFNPSNPIESTYRVDYKGDRLVYFVDGLNKNRVINIDKIQLSDDIESISIVPIYDYSDSLNYEVIDEGDLLSGDYYILIEYIDSNGGRSFYKDIINGIPIEFGDYNTDRKKVITDPLSQGGLFSSEIKEYFDVKGTQTEYRVRKSIKIDLDFNDDFSLFNLYVVRRYDSNEYLYLKENIPSRNSIIINSLDTFIPMDESVSDIVVPNILYSKSSSLVQMDNRLILGNTNIDGYDYDFQSFANSIKVGYDIELEAFSDNSSVGGNYEGSGALNNTQIPLLNGEFSDGSSIEVMSFSTPYYLGNTDDKEEAGKTFMRDEVYALGVYFELENGQFTDVYHIPGREANTTIGPEYNGLSDEYGRVVGSTDVNGNWDTNPVTVDGVTDQAWKLINTAVQGTLGYYECEDEYPDGYGFPSGKIRHHRIPSDKVEPLFQSVNFEGNEIPYYTNRRYIKLTFDYTLPSELVGVVKNVFFTHAIKDEYNKKVNSKGLVYRTRDVNGNIRQSESLNRLLSSSANPETISENFYEFMSPDVDFKFKEFNINSKFAKINSIYYGYVSYASKVNRSDTSWIPGPVYPGSYMNAAGISNPSEENTNNYIYNYKQEFGANRIKYSWITNSIPGLKQYEIEDSLFIDNNSTSFNSGKNIKFIGSQKTSIFKTKTGSPGNTPGIFNNDDVLSTALSTIPSFITDNNLSSSYGGFYKEGLPEPSFSSSVKSIKNPELTGYDTTLYVTLLSNNNNIHSDILNLDYILGNNKDYLYGDCYIEYHNTKKSYSAIVTNNNYRAIKSLARDHVKDSVKVDSYSLGILTYESVDNIDTSAYDNYITYPVETRINVRLRRHDTEDNIFNPYIMIRNNYSTYALEELSNKQMVYDINRQYLNNNSLYRLRSNSIKIDNLSNQNRQITNRIIYSDLQNNESIVDSFRSFRANNYKDIETYKGPINKLFVKNNSLYILTRDSLFVIQNNNQQLVTVDSSNITVGSGEFFAQNPQELINLETGYAGTSSKLSFSENKYGYVFVDRIRNKIILFNDSLNDINDLGLEEDLSVNLINHFPELSDNLDNPLLGYGITSGFDPETDRIFITKLDYKPTELLLNSEFSINNGLFYIDGDLIDFNNTDYFENKSFTATFDGVNNSWVSYHDYFPTNYINHPKILKVKEYDLNSIKKYGDDFADKFIIDVMFNEHQGQNKVFDSLQFDITSETSNKETTEDFFNEIIVYTQNQSTGLISLNKEYPNNNIVKHNEYWNFSKLLDVTEDKLNKKLFISDWDIIKGDYYIDKVVNEDDIDRNKAWYKKRRFKNKHLNVRLIKDNVLNNKFNINFMIANFRPSVR